MNKTKSRNIKLFAKNTLKKKKRVWTTPIEAARNSAEIQEALQYLKDLVNKKLNS